MRRKKPVKVAVIGAGNMGRYHVRNYSDLEESELLAIADMNPETKDLARQYGVRYYRDYKDMLDKEQPQAVTLAVPTPFHHLIGKDIISRGIHLLIEKPIASTIQEAEELIALAQKHKVILTVGHIERFNPIIRKLKELIDDKRLGRITSIVCKRVGGFPATVPKTDVIIDLAVHDIDIMSYLLGKRPKKIHSHGSRTLHSEKIDSAEILLDFGNASGFVQANWVTPVKVRTIAVTGSRGYVEGNYLTQELAYYEHNMKPISEKVGFKGFVQQLGEARQHSIDVPKEEPLAAELKAFLRAIRKEGNDHVQAKDAKEALMYALASLENALGA